MGAARIRSMRVSLGRLRSDISVRLHPFRPRFMDRRFWATQFLIVLVAVLHSSIEIADVIESLTGHNDHSLSFVPVSMFLIPVVYAALNFGLAGSIVTALWCTVLATPNVLFFHQGYPRVAEVIQLSFVNGMAFFVGQRVDREMTARRRTEEAISALRVSESRYRDLFESSPVAVLVLDPAGTILEANPTASILFGVVPDSLRGRHVAELIGSAETSDLLAVCPAGSRQHARPIVVGDGDAQAYLAPTVTRTNDSQDAPVLQVILADVTEEYYRHAGLRAYAAHILRAQEEERKRIAQEAVRNVERHSRARNCTVVVSFAEHWIQLSIVDDGVGFVLPPVRDLAIGRHLGLIGMQERAESMGATVEVQSTPGRGTAITVSVPRTPASTAPASYQVEPLSASAALEA